MATAGDIPKMGFGAGAAHFVVTFGFGSAIVTPSLDPTVGISPTWGNSLYKPMHYAPLRYAPARWKPPRYRKPF